jgi:hypothetical protein
VAGGMICALSVFLIFSLTAWPTLEGHVPDHPSLSRRRFRAALWLEVLAVLFALFVHAPYSAELSPVAGLIALAVLVFLATGYRKLRVERV